MYHDILQYRAILARCLCCLLMVSTMVAGMLFIVIAIVLLLCLRLVVDPQTSQPWVGILKETLKKQVARAAVATCEPYSRRHQSTTGISALNLLSSLHPTTLCLKSQTGRVSSSKASPYLWASMTFSWSTLILHQPSTSRTSQPVS